MSVADWVISAVAAVTVICAVVSAVRRGKGKRPGGCRGCPYCGMCRGAGQDEDDPQNDGCKTGAESD